MVKGISLLAKQGRKPPNELLTEIETIMMQRFTNLKATSLTTLVDAMADLSETRPWKGMLVDRLRNHANVLRKDLKQVPPCVYVYTYRRGDVCMHVRGWMW